MPFYLGFLAALYYLPYFLYKTVSHDSLRLKRRVATAAKPNANVIFKKFFNNGRTRRRILSEEEDHSFSLTDSCTNRFGCLGNNKRLLVIKCLYVFVNVFAFLSLDCLLHKHFLHYGKNWVVWVNWIYNGKNQYEKDNNRRLHNPGKKNY